MVDEFQDTNPLQLELLERDRRRATCSPSATSCSRSTASATPTSSVFRAPPRGARRARRDARRSRRTSAATASCSMPSTSPSRRVSARASSRSSAGRDEPRRRPERAGGAARRAARHRRAPRLDRCRAGAAGDGAAGAAVADRRGAAARRARARAARRGARAWRRRRAAARDRRPRAPTSARSSSVACPTYVIGGRGYWAPAAGRATSSPTCRCSPTRATAARSTTLLASPLVGVSGDGLVQLAAAARAGGERRDPWWTLTDDETLLEPARDRRTASASRRCARWLPEERRARRAHGLETLIDRVLARTGYDLALLRMEGGARRMANVRKLMRLAREHEAQHGRDLRGFVDLVGGRRGGDRSRAARTRERSAGRGRGARRGAADDDPPREGARVPGRVRRRPRPRVAVGRPRRSCASGATAASGSG